jgi:hypothetical protein
MVKLRTRKTAIVSLTLLIVIAIICSFIVINNQQPTNANMLSLVPYFDIESINQENHTVTASLNLEIYGIQNLTFAGKSTAPNMTSIQVSDSYNDKLNCTLAHDYGNGTYSYEGTQKEMNWYFYSMPEGFPYDSNFIEFTVLHLDFLVDNAWYGSSSFANYSFKFVNPQVQFTGVNLDELKNDWQIDNKISSEKLDVHFNRNTALAAFIIMAPTSWLLVIVTIAPTFIQDRKTKIEVYSTILVFCPMFIFAIQAFIPPRTSPSVPEFLSVVTMLLSATFLLMSFAKINQTQSLKADIWLFRVLIPLIAVLAILAFARALVWSLGVDITIGLLIAWLFVARYLRTNLFETREKRRKQEEEKLFNIV